MFTHRVREKSMSHTFQSEKFVLRIQHLPSSRSADPGTRVKIRCFLPVSLVAKLSKVVEAQSSARRSSSGVCSNDDVLFRDSSLLDE